MADTKEIPKLIINLDEYYALVKEYDLIIKKLKAFRLKMCDGEEIPVILENQQLYSVKEG